MGAMRMINVLLMDSNTIYRKYIEKIQLHVAIMGAMRMISVLDYLN